MNRRSPIKTVRLSASDNTDSGDQQQQLVLHELNFSVKPGRHQAPDKLSRNSVPTASNDNRVPFLVYSQHPQLFGIAVVSHVLPQVWPSAYSTNITNTGYIFLKSHGRAFCPPHLHHPQLNGVLRGCRFGRHLDHTQNSVTVPTHQTTRAISGARKTVGGFCAIGAVSGAIVGQAAIAPHGAPSARPAVEQSTLFRKASPHEGGKR